MSLPPYRKIDQSTWSRQDHYKYYTEKLKVNYSMTARLDVTRLRAECDRLGVHFYAAFIWCTSNVVNRSALHEDDDGRRRQSGSVGCDTPELYDLPQRGSHIF